MAASGSPVSKWRYLWAKTQSGMRKSADLWYQPLLFHMLDVAAVAGLVWDHCFGGQLRARLEGSLGTDARTSAVFFAGTHDLGKASPAFQKKVPELAEQIGLPFSPNDKGVPHGFITARLLRDIQNSGSAFAVLAQVAGGHHGVFPLSLDLRMGQDALGDWNWQEVRGGLLQEFARIVGFDLSAQAVDDLTDPAVVPVLAGFISIVDWIGSNQGFFPCFAECGANVEVSATEYWGDAQRQAQEALEELGWLPAVAFADEAPFDAVFDGFVPNGLQAAAVELASGQASPYLMIVEAPMGQGKTETALYAADLAMCRGFARGMFVAMPTQATSNAMFKRVLGDYLRQRGHRGKLNLQLVHGDALLAQMAREGEISDFKPESVGDEGDAEAQSWFTAKKRPLLAPFGVGTIDQSLLSVLQTKHWFVRLFGLAGKVVVFDEVHAYDAYMSTILERLLRWLAEVDCTVILLSATLPDAKRKALTEAYSGRTDAEYGRYPRLTLAKPRHYGEAEVRLPPTCSEIPMGSPRPIDLLFGKTDLQSLARTLSQQLEHGGCAAIICNTVNRSIEVYKHLRDNLKETECLLFHARTLQKWRRKREEEILLKFGKRNPQEKDPDGNFINPDRPARAILVATQVVEQSLDLDFDLIISEIAPIDLLLQRLGRLHRHPRRRPAGLEKPQFIVLCNAESTGPPPASFDKNIEFVYHRYVLLRTWQVLRQRERLDVPTEIEALIEAVYGRSSLVHDENWSIALDEALAEYEVATEDSIGHARQLLVRQPDDPAELIERFNRELEDDDDPGTDMKIRAATREGKPSVRTVFLADGEKCPESVGIEETRWLLDRSAAISHKSLLPKLLELGVPIAWQSNAHLRHCRLVEVQTIKDIRVSWELGVEIE